MVERRVQGKDAMKEEKSEVKSAMNDEERKKYREKVMKFYREQVPVNTDMIAERNERIFALPEWMKPYLVQLIEDERDYIALEMLINMTVIVLPLMALFIYYPSHLFGVVFLVFRMLTFAPRFMLTLHVASHRKLFSRKIDFMNSYAETVLGFCLGLPPGFYYIHHVMMHHCENNVFPYDISSTMPHQRDSYVELAKYILRYFTHASFYLPYYAFMKRRYQLLAYHLVCWAGYFVGSFFLYPYYPLQVVWLFWVPFLVLGCALMRGNFSQHVFVCPEDSFSNFRLAFNYINHPDNQKTYNDGYHIIHHMHSRLHWSEMPQYFEDNIDRFAENDAFVFKGIDNDGVFAKVFAGDYPGLYEHWVQLQPDNVRTPEEFEKLCRYRLQPIHKVNKKSL